MQYNQKAADVAAEVSKAVFGKPQTIRTISDGHAGGRPCADRGPSPVWAKRRWRWPLPARWN